MTTVVCPGSLAQYLISIIQQRGVVCCVYLHCVRLSLFISKLKHFDGGLMWHWGVASGSVWVEKQLWLAWQVARGYMSMKARTVKALNVSYVIAHLQFKSFFH